MGLAMAVLVHPQKSTADTFTGAEFLDWSAAQQRSYINAQMVMAATIVARGRPTLSQCIADSFFEADGVTDTAFDSLLSSVGDYADYHPSSIFVVLIENRCGAFY
jgi:hypothetical protein